MTDTSFVHIGVPEIGQIDITDLYLSWLALPYICLL